MEDCLNSVSAKLCPTPCEPMDCSYQASQVCGIVQAGILERVAISFSRGSSDPGIKPMSPALKADSLLSEPLGNLYIRVGHDWVTNTHTTL